jgi:hypothetical protein
VTFGSSLKDEARHPDHRRTGKPIGGMRRFLKKVGLPAGTKYAILTTEMAP